MKKMALAGVLLALGVASARGAVPRQTVDVSAAFQSTMTCFGVQVSSYSGLSADATAVISNTGLRWRTAFVQDRDGSANLYAAEYASVSTQAVSGGAATFSATVGLEVFPASTTNPLPTPIPLAPEQQLYLVNDTLTKKTMATVCLGR